MKHIVRQRDHGLENPKRQGLHHIGNSTHWIVFESVKILTDPWLAEPAEHMLIHSMPPVPLPEDPDIVLISHEHEDHFDPTALERLNRSAFIVAPAGKITETARALGFSSIHPVTPGECVKDLFGLKIDIVKGKHSVPEVCFRVSSGEKSFFFGGDTMLTKEIQELADERPVPLVILPGEYSSLLGWRFVMTPEEAVELARRFRAKRAVLTHHEQVNVGAWWYRWIIRMNKVPEHSFPAWFTVPGPGDFVPFPWDDQPEQAPRESAH